jgi:gliding motility-associated-like protein
MRALITGLIIIGFFACKKSNFSGNKGTCKSIYETTGTSIVINDGSLSPFCLLDGLDYKIDISNLNLSNIEWNTGDSTAAISVNKTGTFEGFGINSNNDTIPFLFEAQDCENHVYIPNAFTANGDGQNDNWKPYFTYSTVCTEDYELLIFDTFHQLVYSTSDLNSSWDGTFMGKKSPIGVYHYILKYKREDGEAFEKTGQLLLMY